MSVDLDYPVLIAPFIMAGVGMALVFAPSATALLATLGVIDHAKASGVNSTVREIGIALGTAVMTAIFVSVGGELQPDLYVDGARPAVFVGAAVLLAATVVALWLPAGRSVSLRDGSRGDGCRARRIRRARGGARPRPDRRSVRGRGPVRLPPLSRAALAPLQHPAPALEHEREERPRSDPRRENLATAPQ